MGKSFLLLFLKKEALFLFLVLCLVVPAQAATFTVFDALSQDQVEETTTVYIDGELVGSFHLTLERPSETFKVTVNDAPLHDYVLCGETVYRQPGGGTETRPVNDSGALTDPDGRTYTAYTQGYVSFFLLDTTPDLAKGRPPAPPQIHLGPRCPKAVSDNGSHASTG